VRSGDGIAAIERNTTCTVVSPSEPSEAPVLAGGGTIVKLSKILCPVDLSSNHGLDFASRLAKSTGAELHVLYVEEKPAPYGIGLYGNLPVPLHHDVQAINDVKPTVEGIRFQRHVLLGSPASTILEFAEVHGVDVVVMGTHGRTGAKRLLMGSVAERVVRDAPCAVITIKIPSGTAKDGADTASTEVGR
jgi:nucleotide-binding universal stress UspA family protein